MNDLLICLVAALLGACSTPSVRPETAYVERSVSYATSSSASEFFAQSLPAPTRQPRWSERQAVLQGYLGVTLIDDFERTGGATPDVDASGIDTLPLIGGGAQLKLGGDRIDWGVEGLLAFNWRANALAFASGGGGGTIAVDVNLLVLELYGGPFASAFLGDEWRVYAGAGPLVQFADYDQDGGGLDESGTGFGVGGYARAGLEYRWTDDTMVGLGARYFDSTIDLDSGLGDIDLAGTQVYLSVTQGF